MRICVAYTYGENFAELAQVCIPVLIKYCEKHKYDCAIKAFPTNKKGGYGFINTKRVAELLDGYDLVLSLEADMLITQLDWKIEDLIDEEHSFFICKDVNDYNGASWIVKGNKEGKDWLNYVNSFEDEYEHEQTLFEKVCSNISIVKTLNHPSINSIKFDEYYPSYGKPNFKIGDKVTKPTVEQGDWIPECFICHLPAMPLEKRITTFQRIKQELNL